MGWDDCRVNAAPGDAFGVELGFDRGGVTTAAARAAADEVDRRTAGSCWICFGDWTGGFNSKLPVSSNGILFSLPSFGRRDSVEPLFLSERAVGRSSRPSSNRASSACRSAIWPLSVSRRVFQSGTDVQSDVRASIVEKAAIVDMSLGNVGSDRIEISGIRSVDENEGAQVYCEDKSSKNSNHQRIVPIRHVGMTRNSRSRTRVLLGEDGRSSKGGP